MSNSSLPFSEGTWIDEDSRISKAVGYLNFSDEVEIKFLLASFNNCSGSETPGFKGDEGFPQVPIFFKATVTFYRWLNVVYNRSYWFFSPCKISFIRMSITQGICPFISPSPATAPEDVILKIEPRLQGFKLKEIFFKNKIQWNQDKNWAGMKLKI